MEHPAFVHHAVLLSLVLFGLAMVTLASLRLARREA